MFLQFLRNHKDNGVVAFNNSLIAKGEDWRLHFHDVESVWVSRNIAEDGNQVLAYYLTMNDGSTAKVDAATWMLTDVQTKECDW